MGWWGLNSFLSSWGPSISPVMGVGTNPSQIYGGPQSAVVLWGPPSYTFFLSPKSAPSFLCPLFPIFTLWGIPMFTLILWVSPIPPPPPFLGLFPATLCCACPLQPPGDPLPALLVGVSMQAMRCPPPSPCVVPPPPPRVFRGAAGADLPAPLHGGRGAAAARAMPAPPAPAAPPAPLLPPAIPGGARAHRCQRTGKHTHPPPKPPPGHCNLPHEPRTPSISARSGRTLLNMIRGSCGTLIHPLGPLQPSHRPPNAPKPSLPS